MKLLMKMGYVILLLVRGETLAGEANPLEFGVLQMEPGDYSSLPPEEVIKECRAIIERREKLDAPTLAKAFLNRGNAFWDLDQFEKAEKDFEEYLRLLPGDPNGRTRRAGILLSKGFFTEGVSECKSILKDHPRYAPAHTMLANGFFVQKDYKTAIKHYTNAIAADSTFARAYFNRASAYFEVGQFADALTDINKGIELLPAFSWKEPEEAYILRGRILAKLGKPHEAILNYAMARRLNASSAVAFIGLWDAYADLDKHHMCSLLADDFICKCPKNHMGYILKAESLLTIGRFADALDVAEKALAINKNDKDGLVILARIHIALCEYKPALNRLESLLKMDREHREGILWTITVLACARDGKYRNGRKALEMATALCSEMEKCDFRCLSALARANAECGDFDLAVKNIQKAIEMVPAQSKIRKLFEIELQLYRNREPFRWPLLPRGE
jgi:tetratricopeptide (TPR) repeat protein